MTSPQSPKPFRCYMCILCGYLYDEALGLPDQDIEPGTLMDDFAENWRCPDCGGSKGNFAVLDIGASQQDL